jgi:hypothetical protein
LQKKDPPSAAVQQAKVIAGEVILGYSALVEAMFAAGEHVLDETIDTTAEVRERYLFVRYRTVVECAHGLSRISL